MIITLRMVSYFVLGGTDIIACFMGASWLVSVHKGEIQVPYLGCHIQSWSFDGKHLFSTAYRVMTINKFVHVRV